MTARQPDFAERTSVDTTRPFVSRGVRSTPSTLCVRFFQRAFHAISFPRTGLLAIVLAAPAGAQTPAQDGQWSSLFALPLIGIHSCLLPTGRVLMFSAEHGVPGIHAWVLDPVTLALTDVPPPAGWNLDCAGHSFLPDGRLLVAGGTLQFSPLLGSKRAALFDPYSEQWFPIEDMDDGRWYPTNVTLPDGRIVVMSGVDGTTGALNQDIERWDPNGTSNWEMTGQRLMPDYPNLHVMPTGLVFRSGPDAQTETFNPATSAWTPIAATNSLARYEAPSVLLPPTLDRVMLMGGYVEPSGTPTNSVEIINMASPTPTWTIAPHMQSRRIQHNAVLLPDGKVFIIGGRRNAPGGIADSVMVPEIFDPATSVWDPVAAHQVARMYHSTALLLPDGRVLAAGGDYHPSGEIYSPPYMFGGARPTIDTAPAAIAYGDSFPMSFSAGPGPCTITLISLSAVTHSNNMTQRYVRLAQVPASGTVSIPAPANPNLAPPGFYMLFVVDGAGIPSVSRLVRVLTRFGDFNQDGAVSAADRDSFELCFTGAGPVLLPPRCEPGDLDGDSDIDCDDWYRFVTAWTASGSPAPLAACQSTGVPEPTTGLLFQFRAPRPNPSHGAIGFEYTLAVGSVVQLAVHDLAGRTITLLVNEVQSAGGHARDWNGLDRAGQRAAPGIYFARLVAAGQAHSRLFVLDR